MTPYQVWIGGFQANKSSEPYDGWQWINDDAQIPRSARAEGVRNWAPGEPNNVGGHEDYLTINRFGNGQWNDEGVYGVQGFIIEYDDESFGIDDGGDDTGGDPFLVPAPTLQIEHSVKVEFPTQAGCSPA
ncbi:C-type lectin domain-containing protein [Verrucomicrobia bacterium]|nr:C-type lectin domain-containing protein [Verrucomicrobiota bacterium]